MYTSVSVSQSTVKPGDVVDATVVVKNAASLYGLQMTCNIDPAVLSWESADFSDMFTDPIIGARNLDNGGGTWTGALSQKFPAPALNGDGVFATFRFTALADGVTSLSCDPTASDSDGTLLSMQTLNTGVTVARPVVIPKTSTIAGSVKYQGRPTDQNIAVDVATLQQEIVNEDGQGSFTIANVDSGTHTVMADAELFLPSCTDISVNTDEKVTLQPTVLRGGDLNDDNEIRVNDATLLGSNFGLKAGTMNPKADINNDGEVNVQDLSILGSNFGKQGCQQWQ